MVEKKLVEMIAKLARALDPDHEVSVHCSGPHGKTGYYHARLNAYVLFRGASRVEALTKLGDNLSAKAVARMAMMREAVFDWTVQ